MTTIGTIKVEEPHGVRVPWATKTHGLVEIGIPADQRTTLGPELWVAAACVVPIAISQDIFDSDIPKCDCHVIARVVEHSPLMPFGLVVINNGMRCDGQSHEGYQRKVRKLLRKWHVESMVLDVWVGPKLRKVWVVGSVIDYVNP